MRGVSVLNIAIFYTSLSGNTEETARIIQDEVGGDIYDVASSKYALAFDVNLDLVFIGSYTWGDGAMPVAMRRFLRDILIDIPRPLPPVGVFGTGDSIFPRFCRTVDEIIYHLKKHGATVIGEGLKIEQSPYGLSQEPIVRKWARDIFNLAVSVKEGKING